MQVIIIVAAFARASIALADYEPRDQLQKHRKQIHIQTALNVKPFQAHTPYAKNGCGIIGRYCYASEISGCYFPV